MSINFVCMSPPLAYPSLQVQRVCDELYGKEADYVDWKHFLVCAAQPWPLPFPHQLLLTLERFQNTVGRGQKATRQQYMGVQTWMDEEREREREEEEGEGAGGFNRTEKLKKFFFDLFADKDEKLDYTNTVRKCYPAHSMCMWQYVYVCAAAVSVCGQQCRDGAEQSPQYSDWH